MDTVYSWENGCISSTQEYLVTLTGKELEHCQSGTAKGSMEGTFQPVFRIQFICKLIDQMFAAEDMQICRGIDVLCTPHIGCQSRYSRSIKLVSCPDKHHKALNDLQARLDVKRIKYTAIRSTEFTSHAASPYFVLCTPYRADLSRGLGAGWDRRWWWECQLCDICHQQKRITHHSLAILRKRVRLNGSRIPISSRYSTNYCS